MFVVCGVSSNQPLSAYAVLCFSAVNVIIRRHPCNDIPGSRCVGSWGFYPINLCTVPNKLDFFIWTLSSGGWGGASREEGTQARAEGTRHVGALVRGVSSVPAACGCCTLDVLPLLLLE